MGGGGGPKETEEQRQRRLLEEARLDAATKNAETANVNALQADANTRTKRVAASFGRRNLMSAFGGLQGAPVPSTPGTVTTPRRSSYQPGGGVLGQILTLRS